jgi:hypothetical protein
MRGKTDVLCESLHHLMVGVGAIEILGGELSAVQEGLRGVERDAVLREVVEEGRTQLLIAWAVAWAALQDDGEHVVLEVSVGL